MKISELINKRQTLSFEFFPPKEAEQESTLFDTIQKLKPFNPDFVSITYGAGGSTREKTLRWTQTLSGEYGFISMMHLTCYGSTLETIDNTCLNLAKSGISNVLALRGDPPKDSPYSSVKAFNYASELTVHIKNASPSFCVGVAGYPECHPDADSLPKDIERLKKKVNAGADFVVTQLFFDNEHFFRYMDLLESHHIDIPVVAGIMPITGVKQIEKFASMCAVSVPRKLNEKLLSAKEEDVLKIGEDYAANQCRELLDNGVAGLHFYTLNRSPAVSNILKMLT